MNYPKPEDIGLLSEGMRKFIEVFERNGIPLVLFAYTPFAPSSPDGLSSNACQLLTSHCTQREMATASLAFGATAAKLAGFDQKKIGLENLPPGE